MFIAPLDQAGCWSFLSLSAGSPSNESKAQNFISRDCLLFSVCANLKEVPLKQPNSA